MLTDQTLSAIVLNTEKIEKARSVVKTSYRTGSDDVSPAPFPLRKPDIAFPMNLFTISMSTAILPVQCKVSSNVALHDLQNYHPVNQTPNLARPMETIVKDQLIDILTTNELLGEFQRSFLSADPAPHATFLFGSGQSKCR